MNLARFLWVVALCLPMTPMFAAGFSFIEVPADKDIPALRGAVWTPCAFAPGKIPLGPLVIAGA